MAEGQALQQPNPGQAPEVTAPTEAETTAAAASAGEGALSKFLKNDVYPQQGTTGSSSAEGQMNPTLRPNTGDVQSGSIERNLGDRISNHINKFGPKESEPTKEERQEAIDRATKAFESNPLAKLMNKEDLALAIKMQSAVLSGDTKALAELVKGLAGQPEKLEALAKAIQDNLSKLGSGTRLEMGPDGSLLMFGKGANNALQIGADGKVQVRAIEQHPDGSLHILNDRTVVRPTASELAKQISDRGVNAINWYSMFMSPARRHELGSENGSGTTRPTNPRPFPFPNTGGNDK